jgi:hypothetical protein
MGYYPNDGLLQQIACLTELQTLFVAVYTQSTSYLNREHWENEVLTDAGLHTLSIHCRKLENVRLYDAPVNQCTVNGVKSFVRALPCLCGLKISRMQSIDKIELDIKWTLDHSTCCCSLTSDGGSGFSFGYQYE